MGPKWNIETITVIKNEDGSFYQIDIRNEDETMIRTFIRRDDLFALITVAEHKEAGE